MTNTPMSAVHVVPRQWRVLGMVGAAFTVAFIALGLLLPRLVPLPAMTWLGLIMAGPTLCLFALRLTNPAAQRVERSADGLVAHVRGRTAFVAWEAITGVRDRALLDLVELITADGSVVRVSRRTEGLPVFLTVALERAAPAVPHRFHGSPLLPALSLLAFVAIPVSVVYFDGVLLVAWGIALAGVVWLLLGTRSVRLTGSMIRLERPIGGEIIPLRAVVGTRLMVPGAGMGTPAVELMTVGDDVVRIALPVGRLFLFYAALVRELRRVHGEAFGAWAADAGDEPAASPDDDTVIREALAAFRTGGEGADV